VLRRCHQRFFPEPGRAEFLTNPCTVQVCLSPLLFLNFCNILLVQEFLAAQLAFHFEVSTLLLRTFSSKKTNFPNSIANIMKSATLSPMSTAPTKLLENNTDFVVVGEGLGGLSAPTLLVGM
jgi:hypothetical protein